LSISTIISTFVVSINEKLMKKQSSILSFALSLFFFSVIMGSHVQAQQAKSDVSVTRSVSAGQHASDGRPMVVVTITINKYAYTGPGRIEESFSSDFQATLISGSRATFQSNSGKATFIWNNIQEDRVITVSYSLEAITKTAQNQTVSGQFFYQNQTFSIDPTSFTIDTANLQAYKAPVTNNNSSTLDDLFSSVSGTPAPAQQQAPAASTPAPAQQTPVASTPAPSQQETPMASTPAPAPQETPMASTPAPAPQEAPMASTPAPAQQIPAASTQAATQQETPVASTPAAAQQTPAAAQQETPIASTPAPAQQAPADNTASSPSTSSGGGSAGLVYRVQIIVVGDRSKLPRFLKQNNITDEIYYDPVTDVPVRVMVGNYADYNSAKARCTELKGKGLTQAFIAPYYMGERITIAEAATHSQH